MTKPIDVNTLKETQERALETLERLQSVLEASGVELPKGVQAQVEQAAERASNESAGDGVPETAEEAGFAIDWSTEGPPRFANGLQILHRPSDFALVFTDETPFPGRNAPGLVRGKELAGVSASLRVPPEAYFRMVSVMASSWNRFVCAMPEGSPKQPRFKLFDSGEMQLDLGDGES